MPVTFVSSAIFNANTNGTTVVLPKPAGVVEFDVLVALAFHNGFNDIRWTPPAGWVELEDRGQNPGSNGPNFTYGVLVTGPGEPSSYIFTNGESRPARGGIIMAFRGGDKDNPINGDANANDDAASSPNPITCPTVVTTVDECMILRMSCSQWSGGATGNHTAPTGYTEREDLQVDDPSASGEFASAYTIDVNQAVAGPTGAVDIGATGFSGFARSVGITIAIAPALLFGSGGNMGSPGVGKKPITKADVLAAREHAIATGAKIKTKFDPRRGR